jgi:DNA-binding FadR family transcriptional regulator
MSTKLPEPTGLAFAAELAQESAQREHASDRVFRALADAILSRALTPDAPLPPERVLSERFGVSRIVVREAVHRLKECELVRVRQGSSTMVLDPDRAANMRLLCLEIELMAPTAEGFATLAERQIYSGAALLELAEQRIDLAQVDELERITDRLSQVPDPDVHGGWLEHVRAYWMLIALWTHNRLYLRETAWYFNLLERQPELCSAHTWPSEHLAILYRRLNAKLRERHGAAAAYLEMVRQIRPHHAQVEQPSETRSASVPTFDEIDFECAEVVESANPYAMALMEERSHR